MVNQIHIKFIIAKKNSQLVFGVWTVMTWLLLFKRIRKHTAQKDSVFPFPNTFFLRTLGALISFWCLFPLNRIEYPRGEFHLSLHQQTKIENRWISRSSTTWKTSILIISLTLICTKVVFLLWMNGSHGIQITSYCYFKLCIFGSYRILMEYFAKDKISFLISFYPVLGVFFHFIWTFDAVVYAAGN